MLLVLGVADLSIQYEFRFLGIQVVVCWSCTATCGALCLNCASDSLGLST